MADTDVPSFDDLANDMANGVSDVKDEPVDQDPTPAESSPEASVPEAEKQTPETEGQEPDAEPDQPVEEPETDETNEPEQPPTKAEERKEQLNGEIRDLVSQRNAIKQEVERLNASAYQPRTIPDIMAQDGQDELSARLTSLEERQVYESWNNQVAESQLSLQAESTNVLREFGIFNPTSPQYNQQLAGQAAGLLEQNLIRDPNVPEVDQYGRATGRGMVIGSHVSPYQLYKTIADAHTASATQNRIEGQVTGQRAAEQMLASAEPSGSGSETPKQAKEDPFLTGLTKGLQR